VLLLLLLPLRFPYSVALTQLLMLLSLKLQQHSDHSDNAAAALQHRIHDAPPAPLVVVFAAAAAATAAATATATATAAALQHRVHNAPSAPLVIIIIVIITLLAGLLLQVHELVPHVCKHAAQVDHRQLRQAAAGDVCGLELVGPVCALQKKRAIDSRVQCSAARV
jgi:hypothetical protein